MRYRHLPAFLLSAAVAAILLLPACSSAENEGGTDMTYTQITQEQAKEIMDGAEEYILLDVRTEEEFDEGHIPGAACLPNETIDAQNEAVATLLPAKDATILVYCRSGSRSKQAAQKLAELGYTDVREFGGIITWPYEIER